MNQKSTATNLSSVFDAAKSAALAEIEQYGLPTTLHFDLSLNKGKEIARIVGANEQLVAIGVCLMDLKLGEAFKSGELAKHVAMSVEASMQLLTSLQVDAETAAKITNCVAAHHGTVPFESLESEVVANADCYRFLHPKGVVHYIGTLTKRNPDVTEVIKAAESKLDEKYKILSLAVCKKELEPFYHQFKSIFAACK